MKNKNKGITLIALVVTIIVLIILAGISINLVLGENGLIEKSKKSKEQTLIAQYKEQIDFIKAETRMKYENEITLEKLKNALDSDNQKSWVNKTEIILDEGIEKIKLTTKDGYVFYITEETIEYKDKEMVEEKILRVEEVLFTPEDVNWQAENIKNVKQALDYLFNN